MTNNFNIIYTQFMPLNPGEFYMVSILRRKKDGHPIDHTVTTYTVNSMEYLKMIEEEIITICDVLNARAYISICPKNYNKMYAKLATQIINTMMTDKDFIYKTLNPVRSNMSEERVTKLFLVDIDDEETYIKLSKVLEKYILFDLPTKHGHHLICRPFNKAEIMIGYKVDIHANGLTILYENLKDK